MEHPPTVSMGVVRLVAICMILVAVTVIWLVLT